MLAAIDSIANLRGCPAAAALLVGVEHFLHTNVAARAVQTFKAAAQAGVTLALAVTLARELIDRAGIRARSGIRALLRRPAILAPKSLRRQDRRQLLSCARRRCVIRAFPRLHARL